MRTTRPVVFSMLTVALLVGFSGCGSDEPEMSQEEKDKKRGTLTVKINNVSWKADKIEVTKNTKSDVWQMGTSGDGKGIAINLASLEFMPSDIKTFDFNKEYNDAFNIQGEYYFDQMVRNESSNSGTLTIIKLSADSLVANFSFKTSHYDFTDGKISIGLK